MPQQQNPQSPRTSGARTTGTTPASAQASTSQLIEKGWTVLDAVERPIGNVTDVDMQRGTLVVDGRPAGFEAFEVPLTYVGKTTDGEVHLTKVIDANFTAADSEPRFVDAPKIPPASRTAATTSAQATVSTSPRSTTAPSTVTPTATPVASATVRTSTPSAQTTAHVAANEQPSLRVAPPHTEPVGSASNPSAVPHAASTPTDPRVTPLHTTYVAPADDAQSSGWSTGKMAMGGLALGGLAAAGYVLRKRMRRKSAFERMLDQITAASGSLVDLTGDLGDFAKDRNPAWWGGLAATALPLAAYYAWPSQQTRTQAVTQQAADQYDDLAAFLEQQLGGFARWLPFGSTSTSDTVSQSLRRLQARAGELTMPDNWNRPATWSVSTEAALSAALIAVSGLAIYLARRRDQHARTATIGDVMTRRPRTVQPNATVADAAALMRQMDIGGLPVCDGSRLVGMVTDRDITIRSAADGRDPHLTPVRDIMSSGVAWATETDPVEEAARIMREHRIRRLPVVDERHTLVGMVSLGDLAVDINDRDLSAEALEQISEPSKPKRPGQ